MISEIVYIICLITIAALYSVSYKSAKKNFEADLDRMQEIYESHRESWIKEIEAIKEDNDSLKVDNTVLQVDNTSLKEANKCLDAEMSCLAKEKTDVEIQLIEAKGKLEELDANYMRAKKSVYALESRLLDIPTWRSSSIELPKTNDRMLVCSVTTKGEKRINIAWYDPLLCMWHGNGNLDNVTAWMPLPELPELPEIMENAELEIEKSAK